MKDDLISRQEVLALPKNITRNMRGEVVEETIDVAAIKRLPPVQPGWIPCTTETMPKNKSNVLTVIYIPGRQAHIRSGWYEDGLFMNDNGDTWKATDKEVVGWMYQPKLPTPYREGGQDGV